MKLLAFYKVVIKNRKCINKYRKCCIFQVAGGEFQNTVDKIENAAVKKIEK